MDLTIQHQEDDTRGTFFIENDGAILAEINYSRAGDKKIIISHTGVRPALEGKGVGKKLVTRAVEHAREKGLKILPLCPFAAALFKKTPEWADVLDA